MASVGDTGTTLNYQDWYVINILINVLTIGMVQSINSMVGVLLAV